MKKILSLLLALALVFALMGCLPEISMDAPVLPVETTEATQAPTEAVTEPPTEMPTEAVTETTQETDPVDPRPHPADVQAEQDRLNQQQDRDEQQAQQQQQQQQQPEQDEQPEPTEAPTEAPSQSDYPIDPDGFYTSKDQVALYIHTFGCLPGNYITKSQAKSQYGGTKYIPSYLNIGGDRFYNKEGRLPSGYTYYECDIGTVGGGSRGSRRIVFTTSGIVYYTSDHYQSFTRLY